MIAAGENSIPLIVPYGDSSYQSVRKNGFAYVDKTRYIEVLETRFGKFPFIVRPRRFGKTLFTSMLYAYYDMAESEHFEQNFRGTYIYDHRSPRQGTYRVLKMDFSGLDAGQNLIKNFIDNVKAAFYVFLARYPVEGSKRLLDTEYTSPATLMSDFLALVQPAFGQTLYVIIDEYDQFANEILAQDREAFKSITSSDGMLKNFYSKLKAGTTNCIDRIFITGVTTISLDSMTSGFNIANILTTTTPMSAALGFTEDELKELIARTVNLEEIGMRLESVLHRMKDYYNGYRFNSDGKISVFNPQMCLFYLQTLANEGKEPQSLVDHSFTTDLSKINGILASTGSSDFLKETIERALYGKKISLTQLSDKINLNTQNQFSENDVLSILFYLGYLTYASDGSGDLICPNKVVREQFFNLYFKRLSSGRSSEISAFKMQREFESLKQGDAELFMRYVASRLKSLMGVEGLKHLSEMAIETAYLMVLDKSSDFRIKAETEAHGEGFCDLLVEALPEGKARCSYIIEFKYLPKGQGSEPAVAKKLEDALVQLERYAKATEIAGSLKKVAAVFVGADLAKLRIV